MATPNKTIDSLPELKRMISVDGESFDISNLLGSLPEASTATDAGGATQQAPRRFYPSISKLLNHSSHHKLRDSFMGQGRDSFAFGEGDHRRVDAMPGLTELQESISTFQDSHGQAESLTGGTSDDIAYANDSSTTMIEVNPGVFLPFRRSDETWAAIKAGFYTKLTCFECGLELVAANDDHDQYNYAHVICPDCHTVNPLLQSDESSKNSKQVAVAMGFKKHWCGNQFGPDNDDNHDNY